MRKVILLLLIFPAIGVSAQNANDTIKLLRAAGEYEKILRNYANHYDNESLSAEALFYIAEGYYTEGRFDDCMKFVDLSIQKDDQYTSPHYLKANLLCRRERYGDCLSEFAVVLRQVQDSSVYYHGVGRAMYDAWRFDLARPALENFLRLSPGSYDAFGMLANIYYQNNEYKKGNAFRDTLYGAYRNGRLDSVGNDQCFQGEFPYKTYRVVASERYEEKPGDKPFVKHQFYLLTCQVKGKIYTEYSPESFRKGGPKYILYADRYGKRFKYGTGFNDGAKYEDVKVAVLRVLEEKLQPVETFVRSRP